MSIISDYWRYYANVDVTKDFKSAIDDIYNWFFRKLWERGIAYTEKPFADTPISVSDFPGQEWGFRPIDVEVTGKGIVGARSLMLDSDRSLPGDDAPAEGSTEEDTPFQYTAFYSCPNSYYERLKWHAWLPFAVNVEWGTVYYAYVPVRYLNMHPRTYFCPQDFQFNKEICEFSRKRVVELFTGNAYELLDARDSYHQDGVRYDWSMFNYIVSVLKKHPKYDTWDIDFRAIDRRYDIFSDTWQRDPFLKESYNNDNTLAAFPYAFYDDAYGLTPGTIERCWECEHAPSALLWMARCFGNLTQSILQTYETCDWFLPMVLKSLRTCVPFLDPKPKNIQQFLRVDKPTLKAILAEKDPSRFLFYCLANFHTPTSHAASCRLYERVRIKDEELMKNDEDGKYAHHARRSWGRDVPFMDHSLSVNLGDIPFASLSFYIDRGLYKRYSISAYYKWLIGECFTAAKSGKYSRDALLIEKICSLQADIYHMEERMTKRKPETRFASKYPDSYLLSHNVIATHDALTENYNAYERAHRHPSWIAASIKRLVPCYRGKRGNCVKDDTYEVQQPMSMDDILDEGIQLHHCVGSYYQDIVDAKGDMLIYFMRQKYFPHQSLITIQVNRDKDGSYFIVEASGDSNREPTRQEQAFLDKWIAGFNAHISKFAGMKHKEAVAAMCRDDLQVWCRWAHYSLDEANSTIEKALKKTDWDTALKGVCDDYDLKGRYDSNLYIAAMYGLCCQTMKYTDFIK